VIELTVRAWSAWSPGIAGAEAWRAWARGPRELASDGAPSLDFVPPMQRRRFSRLSKMVLHVLHEAATAEELASAPTVFSSRHGELSTCVALLSDIARGLPLSPTAFSHSVHNAQAGLFSITHANAAPSSSIAAMRAGFCAALAEALGLCERAGGRSLLVVADEPLPEEFAPFADEPRCAYALALSIELGAHPAGVVLELEPGLPTDRACDLPQPLEFLAWMLGAERGIDLAFGRAGWRFRRGAHAEAAEPRA
jgi:hypothetical protein